jgi:glycosyltransferase involved in cell wall biosynthesis
MENLSGILPRVLGLTVFGQPFDPRSWSGSTKSLFSCIQNKGSLVDAHSVDLTKTQKVLSAVRHPTFNYRQLYLNVMKSKFSYDLRSENSRQVMKQSTEDFNVILQLGALFLPPVPKGVLHCSYHDGNTAVSRRSEFSYIKASSSVLAESWRDEQEFYRRVNLIFTMSEWLRQSMIHDFEVDPARVIAVGAGPNLSYVQQIMESPVIQKDYAGKTILFVGVDFEGKGGPTLLEAFRCVRTAIPDAKLRIVGCNITLHEPGVEVIGVLNKTEPEQEARLRQLYDEASLFVLPTRFDCFGIAFVEAMYHRLPCIGSNICAIPEIIRDGETGFTLPPQDVSQWAHKIILLLRDGRLAQKMGDQGFEYARSRYRWDLVVDRMLKAITVRLT